jgi:hypothetical protein
MLFEIEGGTWRVSVDWKKVLPVWFACLAATAQPDEYAKAAVGVVDDFVHFDREQYLKMARVRATPAQRKALQSA